MSSRERILNEIILANIGFSNLGESQNISDSIEGIKFDDITNQFKLIVESIGGVFFNCKNEEEIYICLNQLGLTNKDILRISSDKKISFNLDEYYSNKVVIINGDIGVAENGAIWVSDYNMGNRLIPYSCEILVIILDSINLVNNMHQAYDLINLDKIDYGVFIAGPSKTADIEQSLVIGAHGPLSLYVFLIK